MPRPILTRRLALATALAFGAAVSDVAAQQPAERDSTVGRRRIQILPALGSAPETGLQYGITAFGVFDQPPMRRSRPTAAVVYAIRTAKSQTRIGIEGEHWTPNNDRRYAGTLVWQEYPLPFYGIGDRTPDTAKELFTPRGVEAIASFQQRLVRSVYGLTSLRVVDQTIRPDTAGVLRTGAFTGSRGGRTVELTVGAIDDTRDNVFAPARGRLLQASYARAADALGSDFSFGRLRLDGRAYHDTRRGVLAGHVLGILVDGDAPFDALALVGGGDIMRGYTRGRYRDATFVGAQAEYRTPVRRRLGGVVFGGMGTVAPRLSAMSDARLLPTYGAGLRVQIDPAQRTAVRFDYGRGRDGASGLYIGFNQAF